MNAGGVGRGGESNGSVTGGLGFSGGVGDSFPPCGCSPAEGGGVSVSLNGSDPKTSESSSATSAGGVPEPPSGDGVAQGSGVAGFGVHREELRPYRGLKEEATALLPLTAFLPFTVLLPVLALLLQPAAFAAGTAPRLLTRTLEKCACCDQNALLWVIRAACDAAGKARAAARSVGASSLIGRIGRSSC